MKNFKLILTVLLLCFAVMIALDPQQFIDASLNGISAWALNVLPCVLPFMIITKAIIELGQMEKLAKPFSRPFAKIYSTGASSGYVYFISVLAGYPVGSKMVADLYESKRISRSQAFRMCSFCSNSGPMFIIGTVGCLLLKSPQIGAILFASHALSALVNGLIYRKISVKEVSRQNLQTQKKTMDFADIIISSVQGALSVGAIICLFFIIIQALDPLFSLLPFKPLFEGMVELTRGCIDASSMPKFTAAIVCSFVISFGGFSTIMQSQAMLKKLRMPTWLFSIQKFSQGLISAAITSLLMLTV